MEILKFDPSEQVYIAVDLGAVAPPLPEILSLRQLVEAAPAPSFTVVNLTSSPMEGRL